MQRTDPWRCVMLTPCLAAVPLLVLAAAGSGFGQGAAAPADAVQDLSNRAIVEQFIPQQLRNDDAADMAENGGSSTLQSAFVTADLNGTGRKEFLVALYVWRGGGAIRVLKKQGDSAVVVDEPKVCPFVGGAQPEVSLIDLDNSGRPAILAEEPDNSNCPAQWIFRWDGTVLKSFGAAEMDDGVPCSELHDALFIDLDGDGIIEIVNGREPEKIASTPDYKGPMMDRVFKLKDGSYVQSGIFEYFFVGVVGPDSFRAADPKSPYVITVANGDGRKQPPVSAAEIRLNGELIAGADRINQTSRYLSIPATVKHQNSIDVRILSGSKDSRLYVGIGPAQMAPQAAPSE